MNRPGPATYVTSADEIIWGLVLVAVTLIVHGIGMMAVLRFNHGFRERFPAQRGVGFGMVNLVLASWMVLLVHLVEVVIWAAFFQWKQCFENYSTAAYFALNEYTTVGSALNLPLNWRLLVGMIATAGLLGFAWSTGVLLSLAQSVQDERLQTLESRASRHCPPLSSPESPTLPRSS